MSYTKNIAVIRGVKEGFSADGGALSGIVKAEKYSSNLKIEVNLINFAPLAEGRYVTALTDGAHTEIVENCLFEGRSQVDTSAGFAAVICFVNGGVQLLASAVCGNFQAAVFGLKAEIERAEKIKGADTVKTVGDDGRKPEKPVKPAPESAETSAPPAKYEDEAIAEVNYYELAETDEGGVPLCENEEKKEDGAEYCKDEKSSCAVEEGLARGGFYEKMKPEIEGLLSAYPACEELERAIEGSRFVKINYGDGKFYVFGIIYSDGVPRYICYGLPSSDPDDPPESMRGISSFFPAGSASGTGFWIMYQDADTGASLQAFET